jgi:hypothetical protein
VGIEIMLKIRAETSTIAGEKLIFIYVEQEF